MTHAEYYMLMGSLVAITAIIIIWCVVMCQRDKRAAKEAVTCPDKPKKCGCAKQCRDILKRDRHYSEK